MCTRLVHKVTCAIQMEEILEAMQAGKELSEKVLDSQLMNLVHSELAGSHQWAQAMKKDPGLC